jgi:hypothetical protein
MILADSFKSVLILESTQGADMFASLFLAACITSTQAPEPQFLVGRVIIDGNTDTPDRVILNCIDFRPGQKTTRAVLRQAGKRIRATGVFKSNPWRGVGVTVNVLPNELDSDYFDILIRVQERPGNYLAFGVTEILLAYVQFDYERLLGEACYLTHRISQSLGNR